MPKIELKNGKYVDDQMADGVPKGGTSGQVLKKNSNNDYDLIWGTASSGAGTVTSIQLSSGTGISLSGTNPITTSGTITVTNSAPDQVVALTAGTGINTSGTYPNFTITNASPDQTVALTAGTGIGITGTYPNFTITNSLPSSGGTVTSVAALTLGTTGTDLSSSVANGTTTPVITLNVPTASATNRGVLSSTDWSTFNNKVGTNDTDYEYLMMASFRTTYNY